MTVPAILFGILIACLYGCIFHLIRGGNFFSILVYMLFSTIGFFLGHLLGNVVPEMLRIGVINFGWGTLGSWALMFINGLIGNPLI